MSKLKWLDFLSDAEYVHMEVVKRNKAIEKIIRIADKINEDVSKAEKATKDISMKLAQIN